MNDDVSNDTAPHAVDASSHAFARYALAHAKRSDEPRGVNALVMNAGRSGLQAAFYNEPGAGYDASPAAQWEMHVPWTRSPRTATPPSDRYAGAVDALLDSFFTREPQTKVDVVGHRIVHGGLSAVATKAITPAVRQTIARAVRFAPAHNAAALAAIDAATRRLRGVPQVAVFDTAFHASIPAAAAVFAAPYAWFERHRLRRLGFHGISHQWCAERTARLLQREPATLRIVSAHLGNGCSLAAIHAGRSVDTTMGFTPTDGLMMGTHSGSIDPGLILYLQERYGYGARRMNEILSEESGLRGLSGVSADVRDVLAARDAGDTRAGLAIEAYVHRLSGAIAGMAASLGGLDALAFTGGVGEHAAEIRSLTCARLGFLGVAADEARNAACAADALVHAERSDVAIAVVRAHEAYAVARECRSVLLATVQPRRRAAQARA